MQEASIFQCMGTCAYGLSVTSHNKDNTIFRLILDLFTNKPKQTKDKGDCLL